MDLYDDLDDCAAREMNYREKTPRKAWVIVRIVAVLAVSYTHLPSPRDS